MAKKIVRLTENQLQNIITESVERILNEVKVKCADGEIRDLHGNNAKDWTQMAKLRKQRANQYPKYSPEWEKNMDARDRNTDIASDLDVADVTNIHQKLKKY